MARLIFQAADVKRVVEHALAAKEFQKELVDFKDGEAVYKDGTPALLLVHDQGVYLMSNGEPRDLREPSENGRGQSFCAYAKGCDPDKDTEFYDTARDLVGGDDFAETLHWCESIKNAIDAGTKQIVLNLSARRITYSCRK